VQLEPLGGCIGARVTDITEDDLTDPEVAEQLLGALERFGVLVFRGLDLDDETQVAFSRMLGDVERFPLNPDLPELFVVSFDPAVTPAAGYLRGTVHWHIDGATDDIPTKATMLRAVTVAAEGGETEFSNTYAAWDALPPERQDALRDVKVVHSFEAAQRLENPDPSDDEVAYWRLRPSKVQPLAWRHRSGRTSLVLGATVDHVADMDRAEGDALVEELEAWATDERFVYRHRWEPGDVVIWDNRGTMHRVLPYSETSGRRMHRTTLVGDEAFA
jgi:alpha-ketoglutarate-dependent taurine dioxygenase